MSLIKALIAHAERLLVGFLQSPDRKDGSSLVNFMFNDLFHSDAFFIEKTPDKMRNWTPGSSFQNDLHQQFVESYVISAGNAALDNLVSKGLIEATSDPTVLRVRPTELMLSSLKEHSEGNGLEIETMAPHCHKDVPDGFKYEASQLRYYKCIPSCYHCVIDQWGKKLMGSKEYSKEYINRQVTLWKMILATGKEYTMESSSYKNRIEDRGRQVAYAPLLSEFGCSWARSIACTKEPVKLTKEGIWAVGWSIMVILKRYYGNQLSRLDFCIEGLRIRGEIRDNAEQQGISYAEAVNAYVGFDPEKGIGPAEQALALWALVSEPLEAWRLLLERDTKTSGISIYAWLSGDTSILDAVGFNANAYFSKDAYSPSGRYEDREVVKARFMPFVYGLENPYEGLASKHVTVLKEALEGVYAPIVAYREAIMTWAGENWKIHSHFQLPFVNRIPRFKKVWVGDTKEVVWYDVKEDVYHSFPVTFKYQLDRRELSRWFPCTLMHGYDAFTMNAVCERFAEEEREIRAIHDAVLVHPNDIPFLYNVWDNVFRETRVTYIRQWLKNFPNSHLGRFFKKANPEPSIYIPHLILR